MPSIEPFSVCIGDEPLEGLRRRVKSTRWPDSIPGVRGRFGIDPALVEALARAWIGGFDWRGIEAECNRVPQYLFHSRIGSIHYAHIRASSPSPHALLLIPGWPNWFRELLPLAGRMADPERSGASSELACNVVVASMPGYGFSQRPDRPGVDTFEIADTFAALMEALDYPRFVAQGGDWGATVATVLAWKHPQMIRGVHLNYIPQSYVPRFPPEEPASPEELAYPSERDRWASELGAYAHVQRTQPQTLAYALNDSPVGLLAWIADKYITWSDCGGVLERRFAHDDVLAAATVYWTTETFNSSARLYLEHARSGLATLSRDQLTVPFAVARFAREAPFPPRRWVERLYPVMQWTEFPVGGHFPFWEEPDLLAADLRSFLRLLSVPRRAGFALGGGQP